MCPFLSKTKPDPNPPTFSDVSPICTLTLTTPGSDFSKISINDKFFEYGDSSSISGAWDFNVIGSPENIGPQTGEGEYIGTVENNLLWINLNPEWADNNVHLDGTIDGNKITGNWVYSVFAGSMNHGTFSAEK